MTVRNQNVILYRGNSAAIEVDITQADGTPYDPSVGAAFRYRVAATSHADEADSLISKTSEDGSITAQPGGIMIVLEADETDLDPAVYYHELRAWEGIDEATVLVGALVIKPALRMQVVLPP